VSHFLWIEDFAKFDNEVSHTPKSTATQVFGGVLDESIFSESKQELKRRLKEHGIFIELSFQNGWRFIREDLAKIDYVILDIDLLAYSVYPPDDDVKRILKDYYGCSDAEDEALLGTACAELKKVAGFHLYTELVVELGFPKDHILFVSNHGNDLASFRDAFMAAKISPPRIHEKLETGFDHNPKVRDWIKEKHQTPYSRLRRGVIEGCRALRVAPADRLKFHEFKSSRENSKDLTRDEWREYLLDYLQSLEELLPLREPKDSEKSTLYKLFIRLLAHEWEAKEAGHRQSVETERSPQEVFAFSWIMKMARNWSAHGRVFESATEKDVAFLFIVNMRAMFDLGNDILSYESHLLSLFADIAISESDFRVKNGSDHNDRKLPLIENYARLIRALRNSYQAITFHDALNEVQKSKTSAPEYLLKGLFQTFWYLTSVGYVYLPPDMERTRTFTKINYQFKHFDYTKMSYILEIARHIYTTSFPEA
jgi:hypothetical protein